MEENHISPVTTSTYACSNTACREKTERKAAEQKELVRVREEKRLERISKLKKQ